MNTFTPIEEKPIIVLKKDVPLKYFYVITNNNVRINLIDRISLEDYFKLLRKNISNS